MFDAAGASLVSVTQSFSTTTSMGRLTLNMLLSFAQFEREVTSERIRDKIAASQRKGLWTGGTVPLGYRAVDTKLVVHEAETVRAIYELYLQHGTVRDVREALTEAGHVGKPTGDADGTVTEPGKPFQHDGPTEASATQLIIAATIKRAGLEMRLVLQDRATGSDDARGTDPSLIRLIVQAHRLRRMLLDHDGSTIADLAASIGVTRSYLCRTVRLSFLAPDIAEAILDGTQPITLTAAQLAHAQELPCDWNAQRRLSGSVARRTRTIVGAAAREAAVGRSKAWHHVACRELVPHSHREGRPAVTQGPDGRLRLRP